MGKRVLCVLAPGFEEIETVAPVDLLRRAGAEVVVAALDGADRVVGRSSLALVPDMPLADVDEGSFDLLLIPGGPGVKVLREGGHAARLAKSFFESGRIVAAICAAPTVLHDAGILAGRRFTAHFSTYDELKCLATGGRVEEDGNLITSRGAGTAVEFGLALVKALFGGEESEKIAAAIML